MNYYIIYILMTNNENYQFKRKYTSREFVRYISSNSQILLVTIAII